MSRLKKRGGTWYADFEINGTRVVKTTGIKVGDDPKASRAAAQMQAETMERVANGNMSLNMALDAVRAMARSTGMATCAPSIKEYLTKLYKPRGGAANVAGYKRAATLLCEFLGDLANRPLDQLTVSECTEFLQHRLKHVSYGTVGLHKSLLSTAFNAAVADDIISKNPFAYTRLDHIAPRDMPRKLKRLPFTSQEMHIMLTKFASPWRELVAVSFLTGGQRIGDICRLPWSGVDFIAGLVTINPKKTGYAGQTIVAPMIAPLRAVLESLYKPGEEYVFPELHDMYESSRGSVSTQFTAMLRAYGIVSKIDKSQGAGRGFSEKSFHSIRHTVVSMLRSSNQFSQDLARQIVGHNSEAVERAYFTADISSKQAGIEYLFNQVQKAPTALLP